MEGTINLPQEVAWVHLSYHPISESFQATYVLKEHQIYVQPLENHHRLINLQGTTPELINAREEYIFSVHPFSLTFSPTNVELLTSSVHAIFYIVMETRSTR